MFILSSWVFALSSNRLRMFYPTDFYHTPPPIRKFEQRHGRAFDLFKKTQRKILLASKVVSNAKISRFKVTTFIAQYCEKSTIHGLRYIVDGTLNGMERYTWVILVILAAIGTIHVSLLSQQRFQNSTLATVVESTNFPIYDIPFPAVTICNFNRVNYIRVPNVVDS